MKILYLHQHFTTREGSGGTRSYEFARLLQQRGHDVIILCGSGDRRGMEARTSKLIEQRELSGVKVIQLNVPYSQQMGYRRRVMSFIWFMLLASYVAARQGGIDVILASSTPLTIAVPAIVASFVRRVPFVFEVRDLWPEVPIGLGVLRNPFLIAFVRGLERIAYRCATHIVALSPGMKDGILRTGTHAEKVSVIPNACDNDLFDVPNEQGLSFRARHPHLKDRPLVVYTGAFGMVNGLEYLVRLAHQVGLSDPEVAFLLVGAGREKETLTEFAQKLGILNKNFWMMDAIPRHELPEILSAATVATSTVIPTPVLWHNSANKFFDALAAGRPIAINHCGWQADLLQESGAGIVLPADNIEAAARILLDFLHSNARQERARQAARELALGEFDRTQLVGQLESILLSKCLKTTTTSVVTNE